MRRGGCATPTPWEDDLRIMRAEYVVLSSISSELILGLGAPLAGPPSEGLLGPLLRIWREGDIASMSRCLLIGLLELPVAGESIFVMRLPGARSSGPVCEPRRFRSGAKSMLPILTIWRTSSAVGLLSG